MKKNIVTPEWLAGICMELDGEDSVVVTDHVKSNNMIQNYHNKHYADILRTEAEDYDPEDE